ncbi:MAG: bifunctional precorrin-2 dehydrogenase/sirohydrochlorin ferrochelatase [Candidatus Methanoperedens sp.]|nr:bifunctional precorrin-2 dehydrogenase/sirohydrochlorin ferrochelatase [Candidatus Methanoperedens sp.]
MKDHLPLMLDLTSKEIVIFGGGDVGERKASLFCEHARVTIISREFTPGLNALFQKEKIKLIKVKDLTETDIRQFMKNAFITIPATNDSLLNEKIASIAGENGKLVNRVDDMGDIIVPSVIKRGNVVIGISTVGQSPALSKYIRLKLQEVIKPEFEQMSKLQQEFRELLKSKVNDQKIRRDILWNILNDNDVWAAFGESYEKAYKAASRHIDRIGERNV